MITNCTAQYRQIAAQISQHVVKFKHCFKSQPA